MHGAAQDRRTTCSLPDEMGKEKMGSVPTGLIIFALQAHWRVRVPRNVLVLWLYPVPRLSSQLRLESSADPRLQRDCRGMEILQR